MTTRVREVQPDRVVVVKRYTRRHIEQEHEAMKAAARETQRRLISASIKWKRKTKVRMFALRLIIGMLLSEDQELHSVGRELALRAGLDRSRRFAERHTADKLREAVSKLWEDTKQSDGRFAEAASRAVGREAAKWN